MIDVTPLYKFDVRGPDAAAFLSRLMVRNVAKLKPNQVAYLCWCDDDGKVIDDGTVARFDEDFFRVTSTEPAMHWFLRHTRGFDVSIDDTPPSRLPRCPCRGPTRAAWSTERAMVV